MRCSLQRGVTWYARFKVQEYVREVPRLMEDFKAHVGQLATLAAEKLAVHSDAINLKSELESRGGKNELFESFVEVTKSNRAALAAYLLVKLSDVTWRAGNATSQQNDTLAAFIKDRDQLLGS